MAYSYGYNGPSGGRYGGYGGAYGDVQEYTRNRHAPYGGDGAFEVYSGDRDYGYSGVGGRTGYRTQQFDSYTSAPRYSHGADRSYGGVGVYGGGYGSGVRDYEREQRSSRKIQYGGASYGSKSRSYRDTDRSNFSKYRNNKRDTSTSSSSSSDDNDNREGFLQRAADKVKGVFGYGPDADQSNNNNYNDQSYGQNYGGAGYNTSSRKSNKYYQDNNNRYNTSSYGYGKSKNQYNTGSYGGGYGGGYGGNDIVSLKSRREVRPAYQEESGNKSLLWQVNVAGFDTDNIKVSDAGNNKIEISGQAEDIGQHHRRTKQFTRIITLPEGSNAKEVKSRISGNGMLTITVPYTGTGKGLNQYGTRELQIGQGSTHQSALTGRSPGTTTTGSYGTSGSNTTGGAQYQQHTTTSTTRTATNNQ